MCCETPEAIAVATEKFIYLLDRLSYAHHKHLYEYNRSSFAKIAIGLQKVSQRYSQYLVFVLMMFTAVVHANILAIVLPITMFLYALLEKPRPHTVSYNSISNMTFYLTIDRITGASLYCILTSFWWSSSFISSRSFVTVKPTRVTFGEYSHNALSPRAIFKMTHGCSPPRSWSEFTSSTRLTSWLHFGTWWHSCQCCSTDTTWKSTDCGTLPSHQILTRKRKRRKRRREPVLTLMIRSRWAVTRVAHLSSSRLRQLRHVAKEAIAIQFSLAYPLTSRQALHLPYSHDVPAHCCRVLAVPSQVNLKIFRSMQYGCKLCHNITTETALRALLLWFEDTLVRCWWWRLDAMCIQHSSLQVRHNAIY